MSTDNSALEVLDDDQALIGLGSNLGDRLATLEAAIGALRDHALCDVLQVSPLRETAPIDSPEGSGDYLNGALLLRTDLNPDQLLALLHEIEAAHGRVRETRNGPRTLDLDLLVFGQVFSDRASLTLPHPCMHERLFVLEPVGDLCPELQLARAGRMSVRERQSSLAGKSPGSGEGSS